MADGGYGGRVFKLDSTVEFGITASTSINFRLLFIGPNKDMSRKVGNEKDAEGEKGIRH